MRRKGSINTRFPLARIKKIIQKNEEIGKIAHSVPFLIAKGLEHFLEDILMKVKEDFPMTNEKLGPSHLKEVVKKHPSCEFLAEIFKEVEDLDDLKCKKNKVSKRKRSDKVIDDCEEVDGLGEKPQKKLKIDESGKNLTEEERNSMFYF